MDVSPLDKGENVRRDICLTLENMGIIPESSHHEHGPGQNEIDFQYAGALKAADNAMSFKTTVRNDCQPVWAVRIVPAQASARRKRQRVGTSNLSIERGGINIFEQQDGQLSLDAQHAIAGILGRIREISLFLNPLPSSYQRLGCWEAPRAHQLVVRQPQPACPHSSGASRRGSYGASFRPTLPATRIWRSRWYWRRPWRASPR